jgi:hypothetical protein
MPVLTPPLLIPHFDSSFTPIPLQSQMTGLPTLWEANWSMTHPAHCP